MNKIIFFSTLVLFFSIQLALSQESIIEMPLSINEEGQSTHTSAILDVQSQDKGVLFPRMPYCDIQAISSPVEGLMIFDTEYKCLRIFINGIWECLYQSTNDGEVKGNITGWKHLRNYGEDEHVGIAVDGEANIYVLSELDDNSFDFVRKYNNKGDLDWEIEISPTVYMNDLEVNEQGDVFISGTMKGYNTDVTIGSFQQSPGENRAFLVKLDKGDGTVLSFDYLSTKSPTVLSLSESGDCYVALKSEGEIFVKKSTGELKFVAGSYGYIYDIAIDFNNYYIMLTHSQSFNDNTLTIDVVDTPFGDYVASKQIISDSSIRSHDICLDGDNSFYFCFGYYGKVSFENRPYGHNKDSFGTGIFKFDSELSLTSNITFEQQVSGSGAELDADHFGNLYLIGFNASSGFANSFGSGEARSNLVSFDISGNDIVFKGAKLLPGSSSGIIDVYPTTQAHTVIFTDQKVTIGNSTIIDNDWMSVLVKYSR